MSDLDEKIDEVTNCIKRQNVTIKKEFTINGKLLETEQRMLTKYEWDTYQKRCLDITSDETVFKAIMDVKSHERFRFLKETVPTMEKDIIKNKTKLGKLKGKEKIELSEFNSELQRNVSKLKVELDKLKLKIEDNDISNETIFILEEAKKKVTQLDFHNKLWLIATSLSENLFYSSYIIFDGKAIEGEDKNGECNITKLLKNLESNIFDDLYQNTLDLVNPSTEEYSEVK